MTIDGPIALVVRGGWDGHEPVQTTDRVIPSLQEKGFRIEVSGSLECYSDTALMGDVDLIVQCWTMGEITVEQKQHLLGAVSSGAGLIGWHGGLCDSFRNVPEYQFMTGGQWVAHPGGKLDYQVNFIRDNGPDPVITGLEDFGSTRSSTTCTSTPRTRSSRLPHLRVRMMLPGRRAVLCPLPGSGRTVMGGSFIQPWATRPSTSTFLKFWS